MTRTAPAAPDHDPAARPATPDDVKRLRAAIRSAKAAPDRPDPGHDPGHLDPDARPAGPADVARMRDAIRPPRTATPDPAAPDRPDPSPRPATADHVALMRAATRSPRATR